METRELFTLQDRDEIEAAAEQVGMTFDSFLEKCALWVVYNYPEVITKTPRGVDRCYRSVV